MTKRVKDFMNKLTPLGKGIVIGLPIVVILMIAIVIWGTSKVNENKIEETETVNIEPRYAEVFNSENINIQVDLNSIEIYEKSVRFNVKASNGNFEQLKIGAGDIGINGNKNNVLDSCCYMELGSKYVSDKKMDNAESSVIISIDESVKDVESIEIQFIIYNDEYEDRIVTCDATILNSNGTFEVSELASINEDKSEYNLEDTEFDEIGSNFDENSDKVIIYGTKDLGYIASDKFGDIRSVEYDHDIYTACSEDIDIRVTKYKDRQAKDIVYQLEYVNSGLDGLKSTTKKIFSNKITTLYTEAGDSTFKYEIIIDNETEAVLIQIDANTTDRESLMAIVNDIVRTYTYADLSEVQNDITSSNEASKASTDTNKEDGIVGVAYSESDVCGQSYINVDNIEQNPELPTGCEAVAATIVLNYYGANLSKTEIVDNYLPYSDSPYSGFVGSPYEQPNGHGHWCTAGPIEIAMNNVISAHGLNLLAVNVSGASFDELLRYIDNGQPVVFWGLENMQSGYHTLALIGYDTNKGVCYFADPLKSGIQEYNIEMTRKAYNTRGKQAIVVNSNII